jgi:hypothetical protein
MGRTLITRDIEGFELVDVYASTYAFGSNTISITVTAQDGSGYATVELTEKEAKKVIKALKTAIAELSA